MSVTSITVSDNGISNTIEVSAVTELDRDRLRRFVWAMIAFNGLDVQIERDGQPMNLCATPGCPMLVEVRGDTCPRCLDPMAPDYDALGAESDHTAMEDSRLAAELVAIQ